MSTWGWRSTTTMRRKSFAVTEHQAKAMFAHRMQDHAPPLVSHSFPACHESWIQPGDVDISEIQSNSSHKTRHLGNGDIMAMPHWSKGFAISAQHNHRCHIPIHEGVQSPQDTKWFLTWMCRKGSFRGPAALRSTGPSYAYPMGL